MAIPENPDALLSRQQVAAALTEAGFKTSPNTLATKATRGAGPPFFKYGPKTVYKWSDSLGWAQGRLTPAHRSTSEADVQDAS
jgi:hypothetical protein